MRAPVVGVTRIDDTRLQPEAGVAVTMSIQPCDSDAAPVANALVHTGAARGLTVTGAEADAVLVPPEAMTGNMPANC